MDAKIREIVCEVASPVESELGKLPFAIPTPGDIAFLFLSSPLVKQVLFNRKFYFRDQELTNELIHELTLSEISYMDENGELIELQESPLYLDTLDRFINEILLSSAASAGICITALIGSDEEMRNMIDSWKSNIPETIEICLHTVNRCMAETNYIIDGIWS